VSDTQTNTIKRSSSNFADEPVGCSPIFPEFSQLGAAPGLSETARIIQLRDPSFEEVQNASALRRVELAELPVRLGR
jgi:hypothetical protein